MRIGDQAKKATDEVPTGCIVVREILRPERDVVRQTYGDDPDGGEFADAPDLETGARPWLRKLLLSPA